MPNEVSAQSSTCSCVWKGKTQGPRGWVELIVKRDPNCPVHGDD